MPPTLCYWLQFPHIPLCGPAWKSRVFCRTLWKILSDLVEINQQVQSCCQEKRSSWWVHSVVLLCVSLGNQVDGEIPINPWRRPVLKRSISCFKTIFMWKMEKKKQKGAGFVSGLEPKRNVCWKFPAEENQAFQEWGCRGGREGQWRCLCQAASGTWRIPTSGTRS